MKHYLLAFWNRGIRNQLMIGIGLVLIFIIVLFAHVVTKKNSDFLHEQGLKQATNRAAMLAATSRVWVMANDYEGLAEVVQDFRIYEDVSYAAVIDMDGKVMAHSDPALVGRYIADAQRIDYMQWLETRPTTDSLRIFEQHEKYIELGQVIRYQDQPLGWVNLRVDQSVRQQNIEAVRMQGVIFSSLALIVAILLSYTTASGLTHALHRLINTMQQVRHGSASVRAEESGVYEVRQLSREFNLMLDSLTEKEAALRHTQQELREDIKKRARVEQEIRQLNDNLETIVAKRTEELILARDNAEAANRTKSLFLANMSHELRTPLNAILGFSQLMRDDPAIPHTQKDNLDIINRSGEHLLNLINDVLDMSKIESGRIVLDIADFDLGQLMLDITDMMRVRAREKGISLVLDQSSRFPRFVRGDAAKLRQILINLLGNAVKFTEEGGVTLRLDAEENQKDGLTLHVEVEDSGPGIAQADIERIFQPFEQLANAATQKGTGLGLPITRQFIDMMGGEIHADSVLGQGSVFSFSIQLEHASQEGASIEQATVKRHVIGLAPGQPQWRVLIVEDQLENQLLLKNILEKAGFANRIANNGKEAVELFQRWQPHFIWMDRRMPVMDGLAATREIRRLPGGDAVIIVALTASVFENQKQALIDAGCNDFLRKPYRPDEIYDYMSRYLDLEYEYIDQEDSEEKAAEIELQVDTNALLSVNQALLNKLSEAARLGQVDAVNAAIDGIAETHEDIASALRKLADAYRFDLILNLTQAQAIP